MKSELLKQIRGLFSQKKVKRNRRVLIFLFFVFLSSLIWFFNKLEKDYFTTLTIPVKFYHFPDDKIQINPLPKQLNVNVYGRGFTLLRYKLLSLNTIYLDVLSNIKTVKNSDRELLYFNSESIIPSIDRELSGEMKIMSIEPKDIKLIFSKKQSKKVFVVPNISYSINKNYLINTVKVIPNTILITGPSFIVDTIDTVFTQKQNISDLSSNLKANLLLQKVEFCNYNRDFVAVAINIEKKTEKTIAVPVESLFPSSLKNSTFVPNLINLKFSVGIHQFSKIDASQFQLTVERINSSSINSDIYRVKAIRIPSKIYNLQITPNIVTILKK
ncbi:MAG TPA: hypothetical protein PLP65_02235 [Bacteroidales bacterium]|nr:hypothetical protein [Bacteroidales bacterium]